MNLDKVISDVKEVDVFASLTDEEKLRADLVLEEGVLNEKQILCHSRRSERCVLRADCRQEWAGGRVRWI